MIRVACLCAALLAVALAKSTPGPTGPPTPEKPEVG